MSVALISAPQAGHREPGQTTDSSRGIRWIATFKKLWPEKELRVTSPQLSMDEYLTQSSHTLLSADDVISIMVGDLQRIREYPLRGFQIHQDIPDDVWNAYRELVAAGYDRHLVGG